MGLEYQAVPLKPKYGRARSFEPFALPAILVWMATLLIAAYLNSFTFGIIVFIAVSPVFYIFASTTCHQCGYPAYRIYKANQPSQRDGLFDPVARHIPDCCSKCGQQFFDNQEGY